MRHRYLNARDVQILKEWTTVQGYYQAKQEPEDNSFRAPPKTTVEAREQLEQWVEQGLVEKLDDGVTGVKYRAFN